MCPICEIFAATTIVGYAGTMMLRWVAPLLPLVLQRRLPLAFVTVTYTKNGGWQSVPPISQHLVDSNKDNWQIQR